MKTCTVCSIEKPLDEFHKQGDGRFDRRGDCKPCYRTAQRDIRFRREYGITLDQYEELLSQQGGVCKICSGVDSLGKRLAVDHNHTTKEVRGLLCGACNRGIGYLRDNAALLRKAAQYLEAK